MRRPPGRRRRSGAPLGLERLQPGQRVVVAKRGRQIAAARPLLLAGRLCGAARSTMTRTTRVSHAPAGRSRRSPPGRACGPSMREIRTSWTPRGLSRRTTTDLDAGEVSQVGGDRTVSHVAGVASEPRRSRRASRVLPLVTSWGSKDASSSQGRGSPPPPRSGLRRLAAPP